MEPGSVVEAVVLDVGKTECLVELSLKPEFINKSEKEKSRKEAKKVKVFHPASLTDLL